MNYAKHYNLLIFRAKGRTLDGYYEKHHIIPKCLNGPDNPENIVLLTAREHFVAHLLLVKIYPNERKILFAARMMSGNPTGKRNTNKTYEWIKERISKIGHSEETKEKMSLAHTGENNHFYGKNHTDEVKEQHSRIMKGRMIGDKNPFFGKKHPKEIQDRISAQNIGRTHSEETKRKIGEASRNRTRKPTSEETKKKISEAIKSRKIR